MIKVTYIGHSGFWMEWPDCICCLIITKENFRTFHQRNLYTYLYPISMQTTLILPFFRFKLMRVRLIFYLTMFFAQEDLSGKNFQRICIPCVPARNCLS